LRGHRERQVAVGNRPAERTALRPLRVDVDPLVVAGGFCELVHLLLGDLVPVAVAQVVADSGFELVCAFDRGGHGRTLWSAGSKVPKACQRSCSDQWKSAVTRRSSR